MVCHIELELEGTVCHYYDDQVSTLLQVYLLPTQSDSDGTKTYANQIKLKFPIRQSAKRA